MAPELNALRNEPEKAYDPFKSDVFSLGREYLYTRYGLPPHDEP